MEPKNGQASGIAIIGMRQGAAAKINERSSRAFSARGHVRKQGRLKVAPGGGPLGLGAAIVA